MDQKIIFVDDEVDVLKSLERDMTMAGIAAEYFTSTEEALDYLNQHPIGIVVSDLNMPVMDGITFLKEVHTNHPDIYRVILSDTGVENLKLSEALQDRIVEQCFDKPWDVNELLAYFERFRSYA